jgi:hypothetical protein
VRQVGLELGVRYVLRGSISKLDKRVRITAQLLDTADGGQIWADRFDSELTDIFEIQDRAAAQVSAIVAPMMRHVEIERARRKSTDNLTAYDLFLQALPLCRLHTTNHDEALRLLFRAIELDSAYAAPYGLAALCFRAQLANGRQMPDDPRVGEGIRLAHLAAETGENDPEALWMAGETMFMLVPEGAMADCPDHVLEDFRHDRSRHRCGRVESPEIGGGLKNLDRLRDIKIEIARLPRCRLVPSSEQEPWNGYPLRQMLVLKPFLELGLAARSDVVKDRKNTG